MMNPGTSTTNPHHDQPVMHAGEPLETAQSAMLMVHGRGATAADILSLAQELPQPGYAYLAAQASGNTWYPFSFLAPLADNEPWLSSALAKLASVIDELSRLGLPPERTILLGFSQGACLALEFAARNAQRFAGLVGLSGGLIGPPETPRAYKGSLAGTPVFLGCSPTDPHIPQARVLESAQVMEGLGAQVTTRLYPGLGHAINQDEIMFVRNMMSGLTPPAAKASPPK
ncbi:MAG TPA: alpha/beta fold hydrolase [Anaerolineales bacterium]|nr:alpha/beta fold hydrolase [Anaerolineales bacterium]